MKKSVITAVSVFAAVVILLNVFSEEIGSLIAKTVYEDTASEYRISEKSEQVILKKNDYIYFGKYNGQNILWKVISVNDKGVPTLLSEKIICFMPFNSGKSLEADSSNWESSDIRTWLNSEEEKEFVFECTPENRIKGDSVTVSGGFLCSNNFSKGEISAIKGEDDKIFLPSKSLLKEMKAKERIKSPTAQAVINDATSYLQIRASCWYWTQDPISTNTSSVTTVTSSGSFYKSVSNDALTGVCPAVKLRSDTVSVCGGNGKLATPYIFDAEVK